MVRVAERPREKRPGYAALPRWSPGAGLEIDWLADDEIEVLDPRVVKRKADGLVRLTFISHLRVVRCGDGRSVSEMTDVAVPARSRASRNLASKTRGSRRSTADITSLMSRSRATARNRAGLDDRLQELRSRMG